MTIQVLDPTSEFEALSSNLAPRLKTLEGKTVGIISNGKEGTRAFFAIIERVLLKELKVASVIQRVKSNYSAPAEESIIHQARDWDIAIAGIGD